MTILIACHQSAERNFKWFYTVSLSQKSAKPCRDWSAYQRFGEWMPSTLIPLLCLLAPLLWQLYWNQLY